LVPGLTVEAGPPLLEIEDLHVELTTPDGPARVIRGVSLAVGEGRVLAIVGESGSGKSVTALSVLGLLPPSASVSGSVRLRGRELLGLAPRQLRKVRGAQIAMIFEDPVSSLNPVFSVGYQLAEGIRLHQPGVGRGEATRRAEELLDRVGIPQADRVARAYPHELSGGMCQRTMIAMAIANGPEVLIADEPTTSLDVTVQAQILDLLQEVRAESGMAMVVISHDLGVVAGMADEVAVMYGGRVVERGPADQVFHGSRHPYTRALLAASARLDRPGLGRGGAIDGMPPSPLAMPSGCAFHPRCLHAEQRCRVSVPELRTVDGVETACLLADALPAERRPPAPAAAPTVAAGRLTGDEPILRVRDLFKEFPLPGSGIRGPKRWLQAVAGVSFDVAAGETLALVGESGCGKSTVARCVLRLIEPTAGSVVFMGEDVLSLASLDLRLLRRDMQIVFQDSSSTLDPRMTVVATVAEPLVVNGASAAEATTLVEDLFELVNLSPDSLHRFPHQLSSGQRQRVGLARALALEPELVVLDEPVSALDVSVQAGVLDLLERLRDELGLTYLFIAHDLSVVSHIAHRVAVMYLGRIVEIGTRAELYARPAHPYTVALLAAVPVPDPRIERTRRRVVLHGELPDPASPPSGCRFRTRCWKAAPICAEEEPELVERGQGHPVACHFPEAPDSGSRLVRASRVLAPPLNREGTTMVEPGPVVTEYGGDEDPGPGSPTAEA
jgi:peptide/nickel transport system ATP-binding protein